MMRFRRKESLVMIEFKIGDTFYSATKGRLGERYKCHVLAIVDDSYVVYKWYGRCKQWWHYEIGHKNFLEMEIERDSKLIKKEGNNK